MMLAQAKNDVYRTCQKGQSVIFSKSSTNDEFGEPLTNSTQTLKAFPIRYSPFSRTILLNVSWSNDVDVILFISKKEFDNNSFTVANFKSNYKRISVSGIEYDISYIENHMAHGNDYLYVIIGGKT